MADPENRGDLVKVASCGDTVEAGMLRALLEDQGVFCYVQGENHRSMLGMVGSYIDINLLVPADAAEQARELIEDFRSEAEPVLDDDEQMVVPAEPDGLVDMDRPGRHADKKATVALGLSVLFGLGTGHFYVRAPVRGFLLLAAQIAGIVIVGTAPIAGAVLHFGTRLLDAIGSVMRLGDLQRGAEPAQLPAARVLPKSSDSSRRE
jgi:hypothetical protein